MCRSGGFCLKFAKQVNHGYPGFVVEINHWNREDCRALDQLSLRSADFIIA